MQSFALLLIGLGSVVPAAHEGAAVGKGNFLIFPVVTELQRSVLFDAHTRYFALVNGSAVTGNDGLIRANAINIGDLAEAIVNEGFGPNEDTVRCTVLYRHAPAEQSHLFLYYALMGIGGEQLRAHQENDRGR